MALLTSTLIGKNPLSQMKPMANNNNLPALGENTSVPNIVYNPTQRTDNQMKTTKQILNYTAAKSMAEQGRTDMRGSMVGYSDTLG